MLPLLALLMVMATFAAVMVVDLGLLYESRARAHAVADLAALAAVQELPNRDAAVAAGVAWARQNGFDDAAPNVEVVVEVFPGDPVPCAATSNCARVTVRRDFEWTFGGLLSLSDTSVPSTVIAEKSAKQRDIVFIFDKSGSLQPLLPDLRRASIAFSNSPILRPGAGGDRMGLVSFAVGACLELPLARPNPPGPDQSTTFGAAGNDFDMAVRRIQGGNSTDLLPALDEAIDEISTHGRLGSDRLIILFSDGDFSDVHRNNAGQMAAFRARLTAAQRAGIVIHALGVSRNRGIDGDRLMLEMTTATGGTYVENPDWPGATGGGGGPGPCPGTAPGTVFSCTSPGTARCRWNDALDAQFDAIARSLSVIALSE